MKAMDHGAAALLHQRAGRSASTGLDTLPLHAQFGADPLEIGSRAGHGDAQALRQAAQLLLHGAGDVPDNLQPFAKDLAEQHPDLNALKYGVIALGDSSYDTFCQGGKTLDRLLAECGASRIGDRLEIDVTQHEIPEDAAEAWIQGWMQLIA